MKMGNFIKDIEKIVITKDGDDAVLCRGYGKNNLVVESRSFCSPDDIFDFNIGAKLAMDRMYEGYDMTPKPKRKLYNGLIYIAKYPGVSLKNKSIYRVKDGVIQNCKFGARPFIYEGMSDEELSAEIDDVVYGRNAINFGLTREEEKKYPLTVAHFVINDKT